MLGNKLVGYWRLDGNANDFTTTNNGTNMNGVTFPVGQTGFGSAGNFVRSSSQYIRVNNSPSLQVGSSARMAITAWVYFNAVNIQNLGIVDKNGEYLLTMKGNQINYVVWNAADTATTLVSSTALSAGTWYFIAAWYDGTKLYVSVNNQATPNSIAYTSDIKSGSSQFNIGWQQGIGASGYMDGKIDDVRIYKRALDPGEINALYSNGNGCIP